MTTTSKPSVLDANSAKRIALIPGDGVGREVVGEAARCLRAVAEVFGRTLELTEIDWGADRYLRDGTTLPEGGEQMLRDKFDAVLLGAMGDPRVPTNKHAADILLGLRFKLDLYVNARPVELLDASLTPLRDRAPRDINFMVFRENTEGLYVGVGGIFKKGTADEIALQEDVNTRKGRGKNYPACFRLRPPKQIDARLHERQIKRAEFCSRFVAASVRRSPQGICRN